MDDRSSARLSRPENSQVFHYSCGTGEDPATNPVSYIAVLPTNKSAAYFDAWVDGEVEALRKFAEYLGQHADCRWVGWRCYQKDYGFLHLAARYHKLTGDTLPVPGDVLDLKVWLKDKYGDEFAGHPRLESAAQNNRLTMTKLLVKRERGEAFANGNYGKLRSNTDRRVAIISALYRREANGEFITQAGPAKPAKPAVPGLARRGRKPDTDPKADRNIAEAWETGRYRTEGDLAEYLGKTQKEVHDARERHRKREARRDESLAMPPE